jgi:SRSO17 transposase
MDCIVNQPDPFCEPFFDKFADLWSRPNQGECFAAYVRGLLAQMDRKNLEAISDRVVGQPYQGLHHFLCEAPWEGSELNRRRVELLQADRRTRSRPGGVLILDDSGVPKKGQATEGVKRQYIGQLGKVANGQVFVTSHYADRRCHWPVGLRPYVPDNWLEGGKADPDFRTKLQLAVELAEEARRWSLSFRAVVADAWYGRSPFFLKDLEERSLPYVVELEATQRIFARLEGDIASNQHRLKEALSLLKPKDFRPVRLPNADGTEREVSVAALRLKIRKLPGKRRVVVVTHCPEDPQADEDLRFLTTNVAQLRSDTVARLYAMRNWVEVFYREAKCDLGAGQYQVRHLEAIVRHWQLVFVAYSLLVLLRRGGRLGRSCQKKGSPSARP